MLTPSLYLRRFLRDENGALIAEAVLVLPFLLWSYLALFVYWDAFRAVNVVQKAAYTVSDILSREQASVTETYIAGLDTLIENLIDTDQEAKTRVTSLTWSDTNNRFEVYWSRSPGGALPQLTTASLNALADRLPQMAAGDNVVLVEVEVDYRPAFNVGINDQTLKQFIVTRPRALPKICLVGVPCG